MEDLLRNKWKSMKTQRTMSLTVDAWEDLGYLADDMGRSRSEVLEVLIRQARVKELDMREERNQLLGIENPLADPYHLKDSDFGAEVVA